MPLRHPSPMTCLLALAVVVTSLAPQAAQATCPPSCAMADSVVNAAGVPEDLSRMATRLAFNADGLAPASARTVKELAAEIKRLPAGATLTLRVGADSGLAGAAAARQAAARQQALQTALAKEGVKAGQVTVAVTR